jgi:hypothetical protein
MTGFRGAGREKVFDINIDCLVGAVNMVFAKLFEEDSQQAGPRGRR